MSNNASSAADVQRGVQQIADSGAADAERGASASAAQIELGDGSSPNEQRDRRGRALPANRLSITTGRESDRLPVGLEHLHAEIDRFIAGCLTDEGDDANDIPTRRRSLIEYRARLHRRILQIDALLDVRGLVDRRGKLRVAWLGQLQGLIAASVRIDRELGLARRQRDVMSVDQWLDSLRNDEHDNEREDPHDEQSPHSEAECRANTHSTGEIVQTNDERPRAPTDDESASGHAPLPRT